LATTQLQTQLAVVILASVFAFGNWLRLSNQRRSRDWVTASAGASVAYVWLHIIPELSEAQGTFISMTREIRLPIPEFRIYLSGLLGFVLFYGLELMTWPRADLADTTQTSGADVIYKLRLAGFVAYGGLVSYLMVRDSERGLLSLLTYLLAMGPHFVVVNTHSARSTAATTIGWKVGAGFRCPIRRIHRTVHPASIVRNFDFVGIRCGCGH
jgi:hypothetical protein